jgi:hypothetical protein
MTLNPYTQLFAVEATYLGQGIASEGEMDLTKSRISSVGGTGHTPGKLVAHAYTYTDRVTVVSIAVDTCTTETEGVYVA